MGKRDPNESDRGLFYVLLMPKEPFSDFIRFPVPPINIAKCQTNLQPSLQSSIALPNRTQAELRQIRYPLSVNALPVPLTHQQNPIIDQPILSLPPYTTRKPTLVERLTLWLSNRFYRLSGLSSVTAPLTRRTKSSRGPALSTPGSGFLASRTTQASALRES